MSVPPKQYGGTGVVSYLTEKLVRQRRVTLFASGDSSTGPLVPCSTIRCGPTQRRGPDRVPFRDVGRGLQTGVAVRRDPFPVDYFYFPSQPAFPSSTTLHGRLDLPDLPPLYEQFRNEPLVSSPPHAGVGSGSTPCTTVCRRRCQCHPERDNTWRLLGESRRRNGWIGRLKSPRVSLPLKIAAKVARPDREYFYEQIEPLLHHPLVEFVGEIGEAEKNAFMGNAIALLFPIDWPEPFGLVMIEAMACGVPVIAWRHGSVPEIIDDGVTGFIVDNLDAAVRAVQRVSELSRAQCRQVFETRFSVRRMCHDYLRIYRQLLRVRMDRAHASLTPVEPDTATATDGERSPSDGFGSNVGAKVTVDHIDDTPGGS